MLHFKSAFWSQKKPELTLPDFYSGFNLLHQKLGQSRIENEELIGFFKDRIFLEEYYANKLSISKSTTGNTTLALSIKSLKEANKQQCQKHKTLASQLSAQVLIPLQVFHEEYKRNINRSKQSVENLLKQFDILIKDAEKARSFYHRKCRDADKAEEIVLRSPSNDIRFGNKVISKQAFDQLIRQMQQEIKMQDHRVPILGTYRSTSTGKDICVWLQQNFFKDSPDMVEIFGQQLIQPLNVLRLVGQRGNKFIAASNSFYQWRYDANQTILGSLIDKLAYSEDHTIIRAEAQKADELYRQSVIQLDQMRMKIEEAMFAHLTEIEQVELNRIEKLKEIIHAFITTISHFMPIDQTIIEELQHIHDSIGPEQDIQSFIQQYAVSSFSPKAIVYDNFYHGVSQDQIFGVHLEVLGKNKNVPNFVIVILQTIQKKVDEMEDVDMQQKVWSTPIVLDQVHKACLELNKPNNLIGLDLFDAYEPVVLVAVLRYFLLELPDCLLTYELYSQIETIYNTNQEEDKRLALYSKLIATLPTCHFMTLNILFEHITNYIDKVGATQEVIENICQILGPTILRSRKENYTIISSTIPSRFLSDIVYHYNDIFSDATIKLHQQQIQSENPTKIPETNKRSNSLIEIMGPTVNTTVEELNKWKLNVFQKTYPPTTSPTSISTILLVQESSPPDTPKSNIMFDGGNLFDDDQDINTEILEEEKSLDNRPPTTHIDSSFFDDDDDDE